MLRADAPSYNGERRHMLNELLAKIAEYRQGRICFDDFEEWFYDNSRGMFAQPSAVLELCVEVEHALSAFRFEPMVGDQNRLKAELGEAVRPFASVSLRVPVALRFLGFDRAADTSRALGAQSPKGWMGLLADARAGQLDHSRQQRPSSTAPTGPLNTQSVFLSLPLRRSQA